MAKNYRQLWNGVATAADEGQAVRALAKISADREGRFFISLLDGRDAGLGVEILGNVSHGLHLPFPLPQTVCQGIVSHDLKPAEKQAFFVTLRRLAERRGRLPDRMRVTEEINVSDEIHAYGGFGDVRPGMYKGRHVAVKTMRVTAPANFPKIRKVSMNAGRP